MAGMSFRKMLGVSFVIVICLFGLMLATSYAWYSYEKASTKFDVVTANDEVEIIFQRGEYINTDKGIPIKSKDVDRYSDKYDFNVRVKNKIIGNEMVAHISLLDIYIDDEFKRIDGVLDDSPFRVDFYFQGKQVGKSISGKEFVSDTFDIGDVILSDDIDNQFELRVYLLDNGENQEYLMDKSFKAKIDVNVVSRVSTSVKKFDNPDIKISSVLIDGNVSNFLPVSGLYNMEAVCDKGSVVKWDSYKRVLIYDKDSILGDSCKLTFTKSNDKKYLKELPIGSYVDYVGNFSCVGNSCNGENVNYVDDDNMGYCYDDKYHYFVSGYRIAYVDGENVYLVSAGALECTNYTDIEGLNQIALKYCNSEYIDNGICDSSTVRIIDKSDLDRMNGDLINNGGFYSYSDNNRLTSYDAKRRVLGNDGVDYYGIRPIIKLDSSVYISGGTGSLGDPYTIVK